MPVVAVNPLGDAALYAAADDIAEGAIALGRVDRLVRGFSTVIRHVCERAVCLWFYLTNCVSRLRRVGSMGFYQEPSRTSHY